MEYQGLAAVTLEMHERIQMVLCYHTPTGVLEEQLCSRNTIVTPPLARYCTPAAMVDVMTGRQIVVPEEDSE